MIFDPEKLLVIAGPCSLETQELSSTVASKLFRIQSRYPDLKIVFKGSFDKANRTSLDSERGPGLDHGLIIHQALKDQWGMPCLTDIHSAAQCAPVAEVCDILQIPAFLCRQTDLLEAAAETGAVVNVKKGQFLSPYEMEFVIKKLEGLEAKEIWQTERGTTFGYQNLVVDMRSFPIMKQFGHPTIMDCTHAVQMPGAGGGKTSGKREYAPVLARAALAAGADGIFIETHPDPDNAISDGANQIHLDDLEDVLQSCLKIWAALR